MAQVQTSEGVPSVLPQTSAPDDYQRVQASPEAFGSDAAQGLQKFGQGTSTVGKVFQQVQVDDAINGTMDSVNKQLDQYRSLNGADALRSRADTEKAIDEAFKQGRQGLYSPDQQIRYDNTVRTYKDRYVAGIIASHADQQAKTYASQTNKSAFDVGLANIANVADDDEHVGLFINDLRTASVRQVQLEGYGSDPTMVKDAVTRADRAGYKTQIETVAVKDPVRALDLVEKHKEILGLDYAQLSGQLRSRVTEANALYVADDAFRAVATNMANPPAHNDTAALREAVLQQESGDSGAVPRSANGAIGPGQIIPATFAQYAKPGEDINDPVANRVVAGRIVDDLSQKYGGDPARVAVGYFSGPGNVAPVGAPQPWIKDVSDANGKSVSSYVTDITGRLGSQGPMLQAKAGVYDKILAATEGNPVLRQAALKEVNQRYQAAEVADLADQKARKAQQDASMRKWGDAIVAGQPANPRSDPNLTEEQVEHLEGLQRAALNETINGRPGDFGPGYGNVQDRIYSTGPGRIVNQEQLLALAASHQINPAGYKAASEELEIVNKPGAEMDRVQMANFYANARKAVTLEDPNDHYVTNDRLENWNKALTAVNGALKDGRTNGLTNAQLTDPANKDSVWTTLKPFLPTPQQVMSAQINHDAGQAFDVTKVKSLDDALAAFRSGKINRAQAQELVRANPSWGVTLDQGRAAPPQVPTGGP